MNNMKKALALVMSLALAASTFVVGAAYDDVPESHENRIAINLLGDLGVMVGDAGTNDFRPEGTLKRSEAAAIVYRLRTGKTNADSYVGETGFSDVSKEHWASGYINYCVEQGAIAGYPDGTYKPDQEVTYAEYIKMVVCALNLQKVETTTYIDMNTGVLVSEDKITTNYPNGYIKLASDQQINEGIDYLEPNDKITRAEVAQGAYNAIFESYYKLDPKDDDYVKDGTTYQHLAAQVFKLVKTTGTVIAYEDYTTDFNANRQEADHFQVLTGWTQDNNGNPIAVTSEFEYADFDPSWLGQEVYVWEKQRNISSATDEKVVAVVATENNKMTTLNANDVKKDGNDFYYTDGDGKKQTIDGNDLANTNVVINGEYAVGVGAWNLLDDIAEKRIPVDLTFVDDDNSPKSPTTLFVKVYVQTEITSVTDDKLYVKNMDDTYSYNNIEDDNTTTNVNDDGRGAYMRLVDMIQDDGNGVDIFDLAGGSIDLLNDDDTPNQKVSYYDGIAKEDKVMVYVDKNGIVDIRKIEEVSGTVTLMSGSKYNLDDQEVYIVAGDAIKRLMDSNTNTDAVAYIDPFTGYVINVDEGVGSVEDYYYVHTIRKEYATTADYSLVAYDYEGNKTTLTFRDATAEREVLTALFGNNYDMNVELDRDGGTFGVVNQIGIFDVNSKGEITGWKNNNTARLVNTNYDKDAEYNSKTGYVSIAGTRVEVKPSSVVFGVEFENGNVEKVDEVKTYVGSFPKTVAQTTPISYYLKNGEDDLKAALLLGDTKGGNTEFTNVTGYVLDATFKYTDSDAKKGYAIYKLATKGEVKEYETEVTDDTALRDKTNEIKGHMIKFDLTTDGKILYDDQDDIEYVDVLVDNTNRAFEDLVAEFQEDALGNINITADAVLTDFAAVHPGMDAMDEDQIYYGIVVESKDGKYIQLVDNTRNANNNYDTIYIDLADDVQSYRIKNDKWDQITSVLVGSTGNITDSNQNYTTYAAIRVVDGDDENDARVTEIYTKTVENDPTFRGLGDPDNFDIVSGEAVADDAGEQNAVDTVVNDAVTDFATGTTTFATDALTNVQGVGATMAVNRNVTLSLASDGNTMRIGDMLFTIKEGTAPLTASTTENQIALQDVATAAYGKSVTGFARAQLLMSTTEAFAGATELQIPVVATTTNADGETVSSEVKYLTVKIVEQDEVDAEEAVTDITTAFEEGVNTLPNNGIQEATQVGGTMTLTANQTLKLGSGKANTFVKIGDQEYAIVNRKPANANEIALYNADTNEYGASFTGGNVQIVMQGPAKAFTEDTQLDIPLTLSQQSEDGTTTTDKDFTVPVTVSGSEELSPEDQKANNQKLVNAAIEKVEDTIIDDFNNWDVSKPLVAAVAIDGTNKVTFTLPDGAEQYVTIDDNGNIVKLADAEVPAGESIKLTISATATLGEGNTQANANKDITLTLNGGESTGGDTDTDKAVTAFLDEKKVAGTDNTYRAVLGAQASTDKTAAEVAMGLLGSDAAANYATLESDWKALNPNDDDATVQDAVAVALWGDGKTATDVTSFLADIKKAIDEAGQGGGDVDVDAIKEKVQPVAQVITDASTYFKAVVADTDIVVDEETGAVTINAAAADGAPNFTGAFLNFTDKATNVTVSKKDGTNVSAAANAGTPAQVDFTVSDATAKLDGIEITMQVANGENDPIDVTIKLTGAVTNTTSGNATQDAAAIKEALDVVVAEVEKDSNKYFDVAEFTYDATDSTLKNSVDVTATAKEINFSDCVLNFSQLQGATVTSVTYAGTETEGLKVNTTSQEKQVSFEVTKDSVTFPADANIAVVLDTSDLDLTTADAPETVTLNIKLTGTVNGTVPATTTKVDALKAILDSVNTALASNFTVELDTLKAEVPATDEALGEQSYSLTFETPIVANPDISFASSESKKIDLSGLKTTYTDLTVSATSATVASTGKTAATVSQEDAAVTVTASGLDEYLGDADADGADATAATMTVTATVDGQSCTLKFVFDGVVSNQDATTRADAFINGDTGVEDSVAADGSKYTYVDVLAAATFTEGEDASTVLAMLVEDAGAASVGDYATALEAIQTAWDNVKNNDTARTQVVTAIDTADDSATVTKEMVGERLTALKTAVDNVEDNLALQAAVKEIESKFVTNFDIPSWSYDNIKTDGTVVSISDIAVAVTLSETGNNTLSSTFDVDFAAADGKYTLGDITVADKSDLGLAVGNGTDKVKTIVTFSSTGTGSESAAKITLPVTVAGSEAPVNVVITVNSYSVGG